MIKDLLRYGNELEISGFFMANAVESKLILFPETVKNTVDEFIQPTHEEMKELLYQLDTLGVMGLQKTILRKSQRQIEQNVSWNVFRRDGYKCRYCANDTVPLTVDHLVLWEDMGESSEDNLMSACRKCNKTRGNMKFPLWIESLYYKEVMKNWDVKMLPTAGGTPMSELMRLRNFEQWLKAQKVKLRPTQRNR